MPLPEKFAKVAHRRFFFFDADEKKIMAFATKRSLKCLCEAETVCMDGTFKTAPPMYEQLVTIQSFKVCLYHHIPQCRYQDNKLLPAVYVLMVEKSAQAYRKISDKIKR
jgi:hypothetical protein